jgi:hypothetical protein
MMNGSHGEYLRTTASGGSAFLQFAKFCFEAAQLSCERSTPPSELGNNLRQATVSFLPGLTQG